MLALPAFVPVPIFFPAPKEGPPGQMQAVHENRRILAGAHLFEGLLKVHVCKRPLDVKIIRRVIHEDIARILRGSSACDRNMGC